MKYKLMMILDHDSKELAEALFEFGKGWPLFRDFGLQLIDKAKYDELVVAGEISDSTYWRVKRFGLIIASGADKYAGTYEKLKQGLSDYRDGWNAAVRALRPELEAGPLRLWGDEVVQTAKRPKQVKLGKLTASV